MGLCKDAASGQHCTNVRSNDQMQSTYTRYRRRVRSEKTPHRTLWDPGARGKKSAWSIPNAAAGRSGSLQM